MYFISIVLGITQFVLISYILYCETTKKSPAALLWATLFIMFALPHLFTVFFEDMEYSTEVILQASLFVILFCILYLLVRHKRLCAFVKLNRTNTLIGECAGFTGSLYETFCFLVFIGSMGWYLFSIIRGQGGLLNTSWGTRVISQNYVSLNGLLVRFIFTFSGLSFYYFLTQRKVTGVLVAASFALLVFVTRNRIQMLPALLFPIVLFLCRINKLKFKHILEASILAVGVIYIVYAIRAFRYLGTLSNAIDNITWEYINDKVLFFISSKNGELGLRQYFYYFIDNNNDFEGFNRGYSYIRMLLVFIPSQWSFGIKPASFDLYMGQAIGMAAGGSTHPTLFGDCFGNLNWFGILLGAFWAVCANVVDDIISKQQEFFYKTMIFFLAGYAYVAIGRGSVYNGFEQLAWGLLFLLLFDSFLGILKRVRISVKAQNKKISLRWGARQA